MTVYPGYGLRQNFTRHVMHSSIALFWLVRTVRRYQGCYQYGPCRLFTCLLVIKQLQWLNWSRGVVATHALELWPFSIACKGSQLGTYDANDSDRGSRNGPLAHWYQEWSFNRMRALRLSHSVSPSHLQPRSKRRCKVKPSWKMHFKHGFKYNELITMHVMATITAATCCNPIP